MSRPLLFRLATSLFLLGAAADAADPLRIYVLRTEDPDSNQAVVDALTQRGHRVDLGVRIAQLASAQVRLSDYHVVVVLGVPGESVPAPAVTVLQQYRAGSGGVVTDGTTLEESLSAAALTAMRLPALRCTYYSNPTTTFTSADGGNAGFYDNVPSSFSLSLTNVAGATEVCLRSTENGRTVFTSRAPGESASRPGVLANEHDGQRRAVSFSVSMRSGELRNDNLRQLFANSVEWAGGLSQPTVPNDSVAPASSRRIYVLRTEDAASNQAVVDALVERGHEVRLGVRASQLALADVNLSDYHAVVALGTPGEGIPSAAVTILQRYLARSGGLLTDGPLLEEGLSAAAVATLRLPGARCTYYSIPSTTFERVDPPDPVMHAGMPSTFNVSLTAVAGSTEICLAPAENGRVMFYSRNAGDSRARPGVLANEHDGERRAVTFSTALRTAELRSGTMRQAFVNAVEWVSAISQPTTPELPSRTSISRRVYVLRTDNAATNQAVVAALAERGHNVSLGVRASQLATAQVRLSDYHAVVALGAAGDGVPAQAVSILQQYLSTSGGLLTDGVLLEEGLNAAAVTTLQLPASRCTYYTHPTTTLERVEPGDPIIVDGIPPSFSVNLTSIGGSTETCLSPALDSKVMFYSRGPQESVPRAGVVAGQPRDTTRITSFSIGLSNRALSEPNLRRLFVNSVEWVASRSVPSQPIIISGNSEPLRVYVVKTGDTAADDAIAAALKNRGHQVIPGVSAIGTTAPSLQNIDVVVLPGADRGFGAPVINALTQYMDAGGRVVVDGMALYQMGRTVSTRLELAGEYCTYYNYPDATTTYERAEPPDAVVHKGVARSFSISLSSVASSMELCINPVNRARLLMYSTATGEARSRPGLVVNEPGAKARTAVFSTSFRRREFLSADFSALFVNTVEWAGGRIEPPPLIVVNPPELSFVFSNNGNAPRSRSLQVTPNTLVQATFTATTTTETGTDWLSVSLGIATTPTELSVRVDPSFLAPGVYKGAVVLTAGSGPRVTVPVTTTVNGTAPCQFSISPVSSSFPGTGGSGRLGVSVPVGCTWTATSNAPWLPITAGSSGIGPGTVQYSVAAATGAEARTGTISVADQRLVVEQAGTTLSFRLEPSGIDIRVPEGATQPEQRVVSVLSSTAGTFTATAAGGTWLSVTPNSGTASGSIAVSVVPAGLAPGTYRGTVTVRIANATPPQQTLPVTLTIEAAGNPELSVQPSRITISTTEAGEAKTERVLIVNKGSGALDFRATVVGAPWLQVSPDSGSVSGGSGPASLILTGDPKGLSSGSYSGRVVISTAAGQESAVDVILTVTSARTSILLSQSGLTYTAVAQGGTVPPQTFGVLNIGKGLMDWTATPSTLSGGSWLSVSKPRGVADAAATDIPLIEVSANGANLRPGEYHGRITISSPSASNSPQIVSVILQVLPPGSDPGPIVRPTGLIFITPLGGSAPPQEVSISNMTGETRTYNSSRLTSDNGTWFTHTPTQATVPSTQPARIRVESAAAGLEPGVRRGVLTLLFTNGAVQYVNVLSIVPPQASAASKTERLAASCASSRLVVTHTSMRAGFSAIVGQGVPVEVKAADACGNLLVPKAGAAVSVAANFSNGDSRLNLVHVGGGVWTGTWRPVQPAASMTLTVTAFNVEGNVIQAEQIDLTGSVRDVGRAPIVTAGGLVHGASFSAGVPVAPGTLITVKGFNLADDTAVAGNQSPLPRELNGSEILLGDRSLPLLYVSKGQVNVQVPYGLPANTQHQILVRRGQELSVPESITVTEAMPGIFTKSQEGTGQGSIVRALTGGLAEPGSPAAAGETVIVYCAGLGELNIPVESGARVTGNPPSTRTPVTLTIGGKEARLQFVGLTPNAVGLYQINAVVPEGIGPGDTIPVTVTAGGQTSASVTMAVR